MPEIVRIPTRMNCAGIDLTNPVDRMPEGSFPFLSNARVLVEGRIESRPGYTAVNTALATKALHSIRRLNDETGNAAAGYIYTVGNGTELWAGVETALTSIDTGYSGNPLSLLTFRPEQSPEAWMYVYDANKLVKVKPDKTVRPIGVAPPSYAPTIDYGTPSYAVLAQGNSTAGWTGTNATVSGPSDRTNGGATIGTILYNSGSTGWCCIVPTASSTWWAGDRMTIRINPSGGSDETVPVREVRPPITSTTITAIQYDSGTTGACSIVLANSSNLARNSLIQIGSDVVRVLSVIQSANSTGQSIRCSTPSNHTAGAAVTGLVSWYVFCNNTHSAGETIELEFIAVAPTTTSGFPYASLTAAINGEFTSNGRMIDPANDYLHISIFLQNPENVTNLVMSADVDDGTFSRNYYTWTIPASELSNTGGISGGDTWTEVVVPISSAVRTGQDLTKTLATIAAIRVGLNITGTCSYGFDCWYFFGTYGPVIAMNAPADAGYTYQTRFRDSSTGSASVPGPQDRYTLNPLREAVIITPATTTADGIDYCDIYRLGGALTAFTYVGSCRNIPATPNSFTDTQSDATVAGNPPADYTQLQPWPVLDTPWSGVVNVIGTSVEWVSGKQFDLNLLSASVILINGVAYQTFGQPRTSTFLELFLSAGVLTNAFYSIASPTLAAQPLAVAFGPLEGPFAPVAFACGDPKNAGTLYYSNTGNLDSAADTNTIDLAPPGEPLVSGETWNGITICGSRDNLYLVRYSYLTTLGVSTGANSTVYQFSRQQAPSGIWCQWGVCRGPDGIYYIGRDGIYKATEQGAVNTSDARLYPLFPHDGQAATITNGLYPVDMNVITGTGAMRLSSGDQCIYFDYTDTNGAKQAMRYEISKKRWFPHTYADSITTHYLDETFVGNTNTERLLLLSKSLGFVYLAGGNTDNGTAITWQAILPSMDGGDERTQKLYVDVMADADGTGTLEATFVFNDQTIVGPTVTYTLAGTRTQVMTNIASLTDLNLYRNIAVGYQATGGPDGPRLYACEPSGYIQPYLSTGIVTQFINLAYPGWKHHRRLYAGIISNSTILFTIKCQDGRTYGPYSLPSTGGQFRILFQMLDQDIKDLAFAYQLDGQGQTFALFPEAFTIEVKEWQEPSYIELAVFRT